MYCEAPEVLLSGPAGTGKSRGCLEKIHLICENVPKVRALICRKTRASLTESALVTFEDKVVPEGHTILKGASRGLRQAYTYPNGSQVIVGGLDNASRTFSTEYDLIYVQEAIELSLNEWELLLRPLRNGKFRYHQILADTNPDRPTHWLKARCDDKVCRMIHSRHEDNPTLWDGKGWTKEGRDYIAMLDRLTGPRKDRLRFGRWVQAEGVVYEEWNAAVHVCERFDIPQHWPRYLAIDFGYNNPFVCQWWARDEDGRLYLAREIYQSHILFEDAAQQINTFLAVEPRPQAIVCDHDAEGRATLERHLGRGTTAGYKTVAATKGVDPGILAVKARLQRQGDGAARLFVMRDACVNRDAKLKEQAKPQCTEEEFDSYIWNIKDGRRKGEEPLKENDHGMDAMRYMVAHLDLGGGKIRNLMGV